MLGCTNNLRPDLLVGRNDEIRAERGTPSHRPPPERPWPLSACRSHHQCQRKPHTRVTTVLAARVSGSVVFPSLGGWHGQVEGEGRRSAVLWSHGEERCRDANGHAQKANTGEGWAGPGASSVINVARLGRWSLPEMCWARRWCRLTELCWCARRRRPLYGPHQSTRLSGQTQSWSGRAQQITSSIRLVKARWHRISHVIYFFWKWCYCKPGGPWCSPGHPRPFERGRRPLW